MPELRWNPLLATWTIVADNRQNRPHMPKDWCPFCPGSGKVPEEYDVHLYQNDFPAFHKETDKALNIDDKLYAKAENYGQCEVILYSPNHTASFYELSENHIQKVIQLWADRTAELSKDERIKYIFPFENRGEEVGVTMPHPHGQIYAYPFVPLKLETEVNNAKKYFETNQKNLFQDIINREITDEKRVVFETENFISCIPYFTDYPYGVFIIAKNNAQYLYDLKEDEKTELAKHLKLITGGFEHIFNRPFPYMMCIHQAPVNCDSKEELQNYFRLHIEFYPPLREANKIKWYASSEMGAWAAANTVSVEDSSQTLRDSIEQFKQKHGIK